MATDIKAYQEKSNANEQHQQINKLAWLLYHEGRSEGEAGMRDIASVVANRAKAAGSTYEEVYRKPKQFSIVNKNEPDPAFRWNVPEKEEDRLMHRAAQQIAIEMVTGKFKATTEATHYYNPEKASPKWGKKLLNAEQRGRHKFGKLAGEYGTPSLESR